MPPLHVPPRVSIRRWFAFYGLYVLAFAAPFAYMVWQDPAPYYNLLTATGHLFASFAKLFHPVVLWRQLTAASGEFWQAFELITPAAKILFAMLYMSACTTFTPMPTGVIISLLATHDAHIGWGPLSTLVIVATLGAGASTVANLNDYHLFLLLLRHRHAAKIRNTRLYHWASKWFNRGPATLLLFFAVAPVPVDLARILAAMHDYPRGRFAGVNFLGRFIRYVAFILFTYLFKDNDKFAPLVFLGLGIVIALVKIVPTMIKRLLGGKTAVETVKVTDDNT